VFRTRRAKGIVIRLVLALVSEHAKKEVDRPGVTQVVGSDAVFDTADELIAVYHER